MTVQQQAHAFAAMAICGACTGAVHDLLGLLRKNAVAAAAADLALGIACAGGVVAAALFLRCEAFRSYTLIGIAAGWTIYALTLGMIIRILRRKFMKLSKKEINSAKNGKFMQEN